MHRVDAGRSCSIAVAGTALFALAIGAAASATLPDAVAQQVVRDGIAVRFTLLPAAQPGAATNVVPMAGDTARVRFTITDTTSGKALTQLHPAAWLSLRNEGDSAIGPRTAEEKVQELLGGSIFSKADADLNTFRVLALNDDATITVVDPLFGFGGTRLLALIPLPGVGNDWALDADASRLYVTSTAAGTLTVIDTSNWTVARTLKPCPEPGRLALQPDGHYLWVGCGDSDDAAAPGIVAVSTEDARIAASIATGPGPHEMVFSADSRWVFVSNAGARSLSMIDVHTLKRSGDIPLEHSPTVLAYSPLSQSVYVASAHSDAIAVIDADKQDIVARIPALTGIAQMRFAPGDRYAFITVPGQDRVLILDAATNRIVQRAQIDSAPEQIAFSSDMAFVRRRGTASVAMIPLKEIGDADQPVPVADFTGGEAAFGVRSNLADSMVAAPGETAVIVANAKDKAIYYYMEGMAAPMGTFGNYDREPRAALVLDRSLREVAPGAYETTVTLPPAGDYDAVFFLSAPRIIHSFAARVAANPAHSDPLRTTARLVPAPDQNIVAGRPARLVFRLSAGDGTGAVNVPDDLTLRAVLAPGTWHQRTKATASGDGTVALKFTPPSAGLYYFYAASASMGAALDGAPVLVLHATGSTTP